MIDGARRIQPPRPKRLRTPILRSTVIALSNYLKSLPPLLDKPPQLPLPLRIETNLATAVRVAFTGFLRVGEFTYLAKDRSKPTTFIATKLIRGDIHFSSSLDHAILRLKRSKADRAYEGVNIILAAT